MARIHIDSQFFGDPRHRLLESIISGKANRRDYVRSRLLDVYHHCYLNMTAVHSADVIDTAAGEIGFAEKMVEAHLAEAGENGLFRIKGITARIQSLAKKIEGASAGGKHSAETRKAKYGSPQPRSLPSKISKQPRSSPSGEIETSDEKCNSDTGPTSSKLTFEDSEIPRSLPSKISKQPRSCPNPVSVSVYDHEYISRSTIGIQTAAVSAVVLSPEKESKKASSKKDPTETWKVWQNYCDSMREHWGMQDIPTSAKMMGCAHRLIGLVGFQKAMELAAYYPTRRKQFYVQAGHKFELMLSDYMALLREMNAGIKLTQHVVREIVAKEETETFQKFESSKKEKNLLLMEEDEFQQYMDSPERRLLEGGSEAGGASICQAPFTPLPAPEKCKEPYSKAGGAS